MIYANDTAQETHLRHRNIVLGMHQHGATIFIPKHTSVKCR